MTAKEEVVEKKMETPLSEKGPFRYDASELIANAKTSLEVESYIAAGALNGVEKVSINEAQSLVKKFLKKGVK